VKWLNINNSDEFLESDTSRTTLALITLNSQKLLRDLSDLQSVKFKFFFNTNSSWALQVVSSDDLHGQKQQQEKHQRMCQQIFTS